MRIFTLISAFRWIETRLLQTYSVRQDRSRGKTFHKPHGKARKTTECSMLTSKDNQFVVLSTWDLMMPSEVSDSYSCWSTAVIFRQIALLGPSARRPPVPPQVPTFTDPWLQSPPSSVPCFLQWRPQARQLSSMLHSAPFMV